MVNVIINKLKKYKLMSTNKKYWKNFQDLNPAADPSVAKIKHREFVEQIPVDEFLSDKETLSSSATTRRDFLKFVGFSTAAASLAACEGPVIKSIPYVVQPEEIIPGVAQLPIYLLLIIMRDMKVTG